MVPAGAPWPTGHMTSARPSVRELAAHTPHDRNRAVDAYRAAAMAVVAVGHWLGMVAVMGSDGSIVAGNLLDHAPEYGWFTWIGQVMPLFFFVGGFASATSLRSAERDGVAPADWIATRLHRLAAPARTLAVCWAVALAVGAALGRFEVVAMGAIGAAIPLWFLANYTIDLALAPFTFRWFRARPVLFVAALVAAFAVGEAARFHEVPLLPWINWVVGWLGFQVAGFAWQDRRLPTGRALAALAAAFWTLALAAVHVGPWPAVMLHHGGLEHSPTHPPSTALILFGLAYSFTAASAAPAVTRWLERSGRAWRATVAANGLAMSVYLWHMTAAVIVAGSAYALGLLSHDVPGTSGWWWTKVPFLLANLCVLAPIGARVAPVERRALLGGRRRWRGGTASLLGAAALLSVAVKAWSSPHIGVLVAGVVATIGITAVLRWAGADGVGHSHGEEPARHRSRAAPHPRPSVLGRGRHPLAAQHPCTAVPALGAVPAVERTDQLADRHGRDPGAVRPRLDDPAEDG